MEYIHTYRDVHNGLFNINQVKLKYRAEMYMIHGSYFLESKTTELIATVLLDVQRWSLRVLLLGFCIYVLPFF